MDDDQEHENQAVPQRWRRLADGSREKGSTGPHNPLTFGRLRARRGLPTRQISRLRLVAGRHPLRVKTVVQFRQPVLMLKKILFIVVSCVIAYAVDGLVAALRAAMLALVLVAYVIAGDTDFGG